MLLLITAGAALGKLITSFSATGTIPVFFPLDAVAISIAVVALMGLTGSGIDDKQTTTRHSLLMVSGFMAAALAGLALALPAPPSCFDYNHSYIWAIAFHIGRRLALAGALSASVFFISAWIGKKTDTDKRAWLTQMGRNLLLLAGIFYLLGEDTGIIWCLKGWADVWRWSPGFMISSAVLIYLMLVMHLPGGHRRASGWYLGLASLAGPILLLTQLLHS